MYNWFGILGTPESLFSAKTLLLGRDFFFFSVKKSVTGFLSDLRVIVRENSEETGKVTLPISMFPN